MATSSTKSTSTIKKSRYTGLIVSIALFLTLIAALLAYTFYTSSLIERNSATINETNRVANSAQAVIKDLFDLENSYGEDINSPHIRRTLARLAENTDLISNRLDVLTHGGVIEDNRGHVIEIAEAVDPVMLEHISTAEEQWSYLEPLIREYLKDADNVMVDSSDELAQAVDQAKTSSLLMNESLSKLIDDVYSESETESDSIRTTQIIGVVAILVYFLIFVFFFVRRLRKADIETIEARRETTEIMQTVSTGLFLLDKDLNVGQQHSRALTEIIGTDNLAGENFANLLRGRISDKDLTTTRQFIEQLYNPRVKEKLVDDLNPLRKVMLLDDSGDHINTNRYLDFRFSRVYEGKDIARILVNVIDVSDAVRLEQRLEQERSQNDRQIEMLTTILNVNPAVISDFIENTKIHIDKANEVLKNPGSSQFELENKLNLIYREIHSLKGESSALKLHSFTKIATAAEDKLHAMKNQGDLSGNDFLPLAVDLDELLNLSNTIETIGKRINQSSMTASPSEIDTFAATNQTDSGQDLNNTANQVERTSTSNASTSQAQKIADPDDETPNGKIIDQFKAFDEKVISAAQPSVTVTHHDSQNTLAEENTLAEDRVDADSAVVETQPPINEIDESMSKIDLNEDLSSQLAATPAPTSPNEAMILFYQDFAQDIAKRQNKKIELDTSTLETVDIPQHLKTVAKEMSIQMLRNAIVHGIELPAQRSSFGKPETGHILLNMQTDDNNLIITVQDDGHGIDYDSIRQKLSDMGKFDENKIASLTKGQLLNVLFASGFSTRDHSDEDGGHGVGLDIIKERVKEFNGKLNVKSDLNNMTKFMVTLPLASSDYRRD